ncbi:MAG: adenylate/guanylate cyclase domain-containing protein [Rhodocyclales bacterium]|nr:adenylate/guanylate cyclase domain-containing protein [Rhodocyclales bacterium]
MNSRESKVSQRFLERLHNAGIEPDDGEELRLNKSLLMLATGLASVGIMLWVGIYSILGPQFSTTIPFTFQLLLVGNMVFYIQSRNFDFFRVSQLGLFLFLPFVAQWAGGTIISTSGVVLWGLLAPIGAILCIGVGQSIAWFIAWVALTALSGAVDYFLADSLLGQKSNVPIRTTVVFFALNFISVATIIYLLLRLSIEEKRKIQESLEEAHQLIKIEQERSEKLLLNILPGPIAERLKNSSKTIADGFADVTVMFADIVNFTQVAANMSPSQVFSMLNRIFSAFDELAEQFGLEKIKTIGDAYMVAGGLNEDAGDYSAAIADMSVAMRDMLRRDFSVNASQLEIRIGIGTGPIVAGVLGKKKFIYDLWGDTVNIASRITSEGVPGMIQCDTTTYHRLAANFDFHEPQTIYLKGKGNMTVYRLIGRKGAAGSEDDYSGSQ